jgi:SP family general alpha glucoside:H+ symporter-like MFS transporter
MSDPVDSKSYGDAAEVEASSGISPTEHAYDLDEKAKISDYKADAVEAENAEHNMGVLEAVREYPMASFWAFVMSFTIVSFPLILFLSPNKESQLTPSSDYGVLRCLPHRQFRRPTCVQGKIRCI